MNILVINCGSSSLKYRLLDMKTEDVLASGVIERIGEPMGSISQKTFKSSEVLEQQEEIPIPDHGTAMRLMAEKLTDSQKGVIATQDDIDAVGHRVVQGGEDFAEPVLVTEEVLETIRANIPLAPMHNPAHVIGIETAMEMFPNAPAVVVFDTQFHRTIPPKAYMYPLPMEFYSEHKVRKYGFHGTSHRYVSGAAARFLGRPVEELSLITIHLGNGCSMAAVEKGKCVDTTMGLTPLAGLMMGTRCGDIDPAIHSYLAENAGLSPAEIDRTLNKESGLLGICGLNDMRDIHSARERGDEKAQLAFEMFAYRVKKTIGAYLAVLGKADALVFTAGIGENDAQVRAVACEGLEGLGISLDSALNAARLQGARAVHAENSNTAILIIPTDEELEIAAATGRLANV